MPNQEVGAFEEDQDLNLAGGQVVTNIQETNNKEDIGLSIDIDIFSRSMVAIIVIWLIMICRIPNK